MSITTMGWGSGAITTAGWGITAAVVVGVVLPPQLDTSGRTSLLILQSKILVRCKLTSTALQEELDAYDVALEVLESDLAGLDARIRNLETGGYLVDQVRQAYDCKLGESEFDTTLAGWDVSLTSIESDILEVLNRQRTVDRQLRIMRRQKRVSP
jgi:hypothetical protein